VSDVDEVIAKALVRAPVAIEWEEPPDIQPVPPQPTGQVGATLAH
jgi:hypothetical protein